MRLVALQIVALQIVGLQIVGRQIVGRRLSCRRFIKTRNHIFYKQAAGKPPPHNLPPAWIYNVFKLWRGLYGAAAFLPPFISLFIKS